MVGRYLFLIFCFVLHLVPSLALLPSLNYRARLELHVSRFHRLHRSLVCPRESWGYSLAYSCRGRTNCGRLQRQKRGKKTLILSMLAERKLLISRVYQDLARPGRHDKIGTF